MAQTILIAGLGLIGGSLALSMKENNDNHLIGYDIDPKAIAYGVENGILDEGVADFKVGIKQADICILAAPVSKTIELIHKINEVNLEKPIIITDVSSVKGSIEKAAECITSPLVTFIGGHPMAGSHKKGIEAAKSHLFENAIYILTPTNDCPKEKIALLKDVLAGTKSTFIELNPEEHDEMTSVISHFPHLIASSLVHQAKSWQTKHEKIPSLAAGGFRDITRIASSNPAMWQDIFFQNKHVISRLLTDWIAEMNDLQQLLQTDNQVEMYDYLVQAKEFRDGLDKTKRGAIPAFYDLFVDIFDQTGALLKVVSLLAEKDISIKNIEILEIREGITGVLRLSFVTKEDQLASHRHLTKNGYETMLEE
ncbi:prephenate dehydrogenase [Natronobacillus azotifigens]|uniref:Prephenate dehydrogenase n=1 Tax=Natronobacillus azotifigens TaxID=472978 RepID=A0A9J6R9B6_9BACI|nr:prephenate dehydrogenase [Natronobacillus azotifigens]